MKDLEPGKPDFNYLPFKVHNDVIYLAGQLAKENGIVKNKGRVLEDISEIEACRQIRICAEHAFTWIMVMGLVLMIFYTWVLMLMLNL